MSRQLCLNLKRCFACLPVFSALIFSSGAQNLAYVKGLHNTVPLGGDVVSMSVKTDHLGNTLICGYFTETADFDPGAGIANITSAGGRDIFLAKYDASGNIVYAKSIGGSTDDIGYGIAVDGSGNAYITGYFSGTADFDPGSGTANLTGGSGSTIFAAKYDASGNYVYAKATTGAGSGIGHGIVLDGSGDIYVTGSFEGTADFDPGAGVANLVSHSPNNDDIFIAKYNASGNYVYAIGMGGGGEDISRSIAVDASGNTYITGSFFGTADFDPGVGIANLSNLPGRFNDDVFVARYDASGNYVYAQGFGTILNEYGAGIALDGSGNAYIVGNYGGTVAFVARYDGPGNQVYLKLVNSSTITASSIDIDGSGDLFIAGSFSGTCDFDPGAGVASLTSAGDADIFVINYDASGNYLFAKTMGGAARDAGYGIDVDGSGYVYTTGSFSHTADFDPGAGEANLNINGNMSNGFFSKLNHTGDYVLAAQVGNYSDTWLIDRGTGVAVDAAGNTYVTGFFMGTVDFDPGPGTANLTSKGEMDIFMAKYDASGNHVYSAAMGGEFNDLGNGIAMDRSGNIYVTGSFAGTVDFDPGAGEAVLTSNSGSSFIAKYDASGNYVYAKPVGGNSDGRAVAVDGAGDVYVAGNFRGTADFDPGSSEANLTSSGESDIFLARYDNAGNYVYAKSMGGASDDIAWGIAVDGLQNACITGSFRDIADFDPGAGVVNLISKGSTDLFIAKYDGSGNYVYARGMGDTNGDNGNSITGDSAGHTYITGFFQGTVDFDPGPGVANLVSSGVDDIFLARYDANGNYVFAKAIGGTGSEEGKALTLDGRGNIYVTGFFGERSDSLGGPVDFDPGTGVASLASAGRADIFVASYDSSGNYLQAKAMGGTTGEAGLGIAVDVSGNMYITGFFTGTADFDRGSGSSQSVITSLNLDDIFIAKIGPSGPLPVELLSFTARVAGNGENVKVNWTTAAQTDNAYFEVERSGHGVSFEAIGKIQGCSTCTGLKQYEFVDRRPYSGTSFYRLRQVDVDHSFSYSPIAIVSISSILKTAVRVYPTITDGAFEVMINNGQAEKQVLIQLLEGGGRLLKQETVWLHEGDNRLLYNLSMQAQGVYYVRVGDVKGTRFTVVRVIKK